MVGPNELLDTTVRFGQGEEAKPMNMGIILYKNYLTVQRKN